MKILIILGGAFASALLRVISNDLAWSTWRGIKSMGGYQSDEQQRMGTFRDFRGYDPRGSGGSYEGPAWFAPHMAAMKADMGHEPTMLDVDPVEWLEYCYSSRRPIRLLRPLAPQQQEELVFFRPGELNRMQLALQKHEKEQQEIPDEKARVPVQALLANDAFVRKFCLFMDDLDRLPPEERASLRPVARSKIQPGYQGRVFIVYQPLIPADSSPAEDRESMRLGWDRVNHFVVIKTNQGFLKQVDQAYSDEVSTIIAGPGAMPGQRPERASPASPATRIRAEA